MKAIEYLQDELTELLNTNQDDFTKPQLNRIKKRIQFVRTCVMYLESNPSEDFLNKEASRLKARIGLIADSFKDYSRPAGVRGSIRKYYDKEMGVPLLNIQLRTIKFILN